MKIVIAGCGRIGSALTKGLVSEDHDIVVIDQNPEVVSSVMETYDVMGICANSTNYQTLVDADVKNAELFIATTDSDEHNMLSCFLARKMGAAHTVARIRDQANNNENLGFIKDQLELSMTINPEIVMAKSILRMLRLPAVVKAESFARGRFEVSELNLKEDSPFVGKKVKELRSMENVPFLVCIAQRGDEITIPNGDFVLQAGDRIGIIAEPHDMSKLLTRLDMMGKAVKNVMIAGASRIAEYLCKELANYDIDARIIERDEDRCNEIREFLPRNVEVICGDNRDHQLLLEEGLERMDAFISLLTLDEENIIVSYFANSKNVPIVVTKVNQDSILDITEKLGLERIVAVKNETADAIIQYARALENSMGSKIETLYSLMNGAAESLEFRVSPSFAKLGVPIKDLKLKENILIAGIIRNNKNIIPGGGDVILAGDSVIIVSSEEKLLDLSDILK